MVKRMRKFKIWHTAFAGTRFATRSADQPVIEAMDISSAVEKFGRMPFNRKRDVFKVERVM
jgi:hypothetical protein